MRRWWTKSAIMCYKRKCKCEGCYYEHFFTIPNFKCKMKQSVAYLTRFWNEPLDEEIKDCTENEQEEIKI